MRWAGHVARMGIQMILIGIKWNSQMERDYKEDLDVSRRVILKWIMKREWIDVARDWSEGFLSSLRIEGF
jgi:hypothetical protein